MQDAFVIAVEQQAKERLERLSALRKIKPVDMTKLSQQVSAMYVETVKVRGLGAIKLHDNNFQEGLIFASFSSFATLLLRVRR